MNWKDLERSLSHGSYVRAVITIEEVKKTKYITLLHIPNHKIQHPARWSPLLKNVLHHRGMTDIKIRLMHLARTRSSNIYNSSGKFVTLPFFAVPPLSPYVYLFRNIPSDTVPPCLGADGDAEVNRMLNIGLLFRSASEKHTVWTSPLTLVSPGVVIDSNNI
jgi:hypothetical protein